MAGIIDFLSQPTIILMMCLGAGIYVAFKYIIEDFKENM